MKSPNKSKARLLAWIVLPFALWLVLVVRATPAQWGLWLANLPVQMDGISGTIWQGRVSNVVVPYAGGSYALGTLEWQLDPWSLLTLSPCASFTTELANQNSAGIACSNLAGELILRDAQVSAPAALAQIWAPVQVRGQVDAQIQQLVLSDQQIRKVVGSGSWTNAAYHNSQAWVPLGTLAFDLAEGEQGGVAARVFDIEGPMEVDLNSQFSLAGAYAIRGSINLRPAAPPELGQLLSVIASRTGRDQFAIEWTGS